MSVMNYKGFTIEIEPDQDVNNPREEDGSNACTMVCFHKRYNLGDKDHGYNSEDFDSFEALRTEIVRDHDPVIIRPIGLLDHSGLHMFLGKGAHWSDQQGWDSGQVGWAFITRKQVLDNLAKGGAKRVTRKLRETAEKAIEQEVETFNMYLKGDVWEYVIRQNGEVVDSLCGMYGYDYAVETAKEEADRLAAARKGTGHDYKLVYSDKDGKEVTWTYEGTDAVLTGDELIDVFYAHQEPEGMPVAESFVLVERDGEEIWSA